MANSTEMTLAVAGECGLKPTTADAFNRALKIAGLRSYKGNGRAAAEMAGYDAFNAALAMTSGLGATAAPEFVRQVIDMEFRAGLLLEGDEVQWEMNGDLMRSKSALRFLGQRPMKDIRITPTFGPFISAWIDGLYDSDFAWKTDGNLELVISHIGPAAEVSFEHNETRLMLSFGPASENDRKPNWERQIILRGDLFRRLVTIIQA